VVGAFGDATRADDVSQYIVVITPEVAINPVSGSVGENTLLTGSGFGANQVLTITYDSKQVESSATTDGKGSFSTSFKPPSSSAGSHLITVSDSTRAVASTTFTIESIAPAAPSPVSPAAGTKIGLFENKPIEFKWSVVEDPSGVSYSFEMSRNSDFSGSVVRKEGLAQPEYTMQSGEKPQAGDYFWRVKAVDLAGNAGDWSQSQFISFSGIDFWPIIGVIAGLVVVGLIIWRIRAISKKGGWSSS
jgi:hypothetical protein